MPAGSNDVVATLLERMNHLEAVLANSLLGFLLTTTLSVFAAVYISRTDSKQRVVPATGVLAGVSVLYMFLAGYYYFMLTHFYAVVGTLISATSNEPINADFDKFWTSFQVPVPGPESLRIFLALIAAPLFPLLFSTAVVVGMYWFLRDELPRPQWRWLALAIGLQALVAFWMIPIPFVRFIDDIGIF